MAIAGLAVCAHTQEHHSLAAHLFGLADWVASENRLAFWPPPEERDYASQVASTQEALGSLEFAHAMVEGEGMAIDEAVAMVKTQP